MPRYEGPMRWIAAVMIIVGFNWLGIYVGSIKTFGYISDLPTQFYDGQLLVLVLSMFCLFSGFNFVLYDIFGGK